MQITLNNTNENIPGDSLTVSGLLKFKNFTFRMLAVKVNGNPVKRDEYDTTVVKDGDKVSVIHMISGG